MIIILNFKSICLFLQSSHNIENILFLIFHFLISKYLVILNFRTKFLSTLNFKFSSLNNLLVRFSIPLQFTYTLKDFYFWSGHLSFIQQPIYFLHLIVSKIIPMILFLLKEFYFPLTTRQPFMIVLNFLPLVFYSHHINLYLNFWIFLYIKIFCSSKFLTNLLLVSLIYWLLQQVIEEWFPLKQFLPIIKSSIKLLFSNFIKEQFLLD